MISWKNRLWGVNVTLHSLVRHIAEVFGRVFVLTAIFITGGLWHEPLEGSPSPQKILKSRGPEMLFSALCTSILNSMECKITGIFSHNNNISHVLLT